MTVSMVVFDLGGVMIRLAEGWEDACRIAGVPYRPFVLTPELATAWEELEVALGSGRISATAYYAQKCRQLRELYTVDEIAAAYQAVIREEFPGIPALVMALKDTGYRTACLSNTCAPHWVDLTNPVKYPGIGLLDVHHASHLLGVTKPNAEIYQRFMAQTATEPAQLLFFDDNRANVDAARACGWHAMHIVPTQPAVAQLLEGLAVHGIMLPAAVRQYQTSSD